MKKLQLLFFAFYILLNSNIIFGMDAPSLDTPGPISVTVYEKNKHGTYRLISNKKDTKAFSDDEKHGHCAIALIQNKWFFQQINRSNTARIGQKIEIKAPADAEKIALSSRNSWHNLVIALQGKNYLFIINTILSPDGYIPCRNIEAPCQFYTKPSDKFQLILPSGHICDSSASLQLTESKNPPQGIFHSYLEDRVGIIVKEDEIVKEIITLPIPHDYHQAICDAKYSDIILRYDDENSPQILTIEAKKEPNLLKDRILQMAPEACLSQKGCVSRERPTYTATSSEYVYSSAFGYIKIQFNIAGVIFTRFIHQDSSSKLETDIFAIDINNIMASSYVYFLKPKSESKPAKSPASVDTSKNPVENNIKVQFRNLNNSSQGGIAYLIDKTTDIFLPSYKGNITKNKKPAERHQTQTVYFLEIEGETEKIPLTIIHEIDNQKNVQLILQDINGNDLCYVECEIINHNEADADTLPSSSRDSTTSDQNKEPTPTNNKWSSNKLMQFFLNKYSLAGTGLLAAFVFYHFLWRPNHA